MIGCGNFSSLFPKRREGCGSIPSACLPLLLDQCRCLASQTLPISLKDFTLPFLFGQTFHPIKVFLNSLPDDLRPVWARRLVVSDEAINALKHIIVNSYSNSFHIRMVIALAPRFNPRQFLPSKVSRLKPATSSPRARPRPLFAGSFRPTPSSRPSPTSHV